jgi:hypothetical protein
MALSYHNNEKNHVAGTLPTSTQQIPGLDLSRHIGYCDGVFVVLLSL